MWCVLLHCKKLSFVFKIRICSLFFFLKVCTYIYIYTLGCVLVHARKLTPVLESDHADGSFLVNDMQTLPPPQMEPILFFLSKISCNVLKRMKNLFYNFLNL